MTAVMITHSRQPLTGDVGWAVANRDVVVPTGGNPPAVGRAEAPRPLATVSTAPRVGWPPAFAELAGAGDRLDVATNDRYRPLTCARVWQTLGLPAGRDPLAPTSSLTP